MAKDELPLITVVTATYNLIAKGREASFLQLIDTIGFQQYPRVEHLVIDGASTDGTVQLLEKLAGENKLRFISEPDRGLLDAFNKGLREARGEYIAYMGSDDAYLHDQALAVMIHTIRAQQADWTYSHVYMMMPDQILYSWFGKLSYLPFGCSPCHQGVLVSTKALRSIGGFDISVPNADTLSMAALVGAGYRAALTDNVTAVFRCGGNSLQISVEHLSKVYPSAFYRVCGKNLGLSEEDCAMLFAGRCFDELSAEDCLALGLKLRYPDWVYGFLAKDFIIPDKSEPVILSNQQAALFDNKDEGFLRHDHCGEDETWNLGRLNLLKIRHRPHSRKYYLLGLPVWKQKKRG